MNRGLFSILTLLAIPLAPERYGRYPRTPIEHSNGTKIPIGRTVATRRARVKF